MDLSLRRSYMILEDDLIGDASKYEQIICPQRTMVGCTNICGGCPQNNRNASVSVQGLLLWPAWYSSTGGQIKRHSGVLLPSAVVGAIVDHAL